MTVCFPSCKVNLDTLFRQCNCSMHCGFDLMKAGVFGSICAVHGSNVVLGAKFTQSETFGL